MIISVVRHLCCVRAIRWKVQEASVIERPEFHRPVWLAVILM